MTDPLGLIGNNGALNRLQTGVPNRGGNDPAAPNFADSLQEQLDKVNSLQRDAKEAIEDVVLGRRDDVESVMMATQKADTAFRLLLQVRNKIMDAYDELKQVRV